jgi:hypothetical protein
MYLTGILRHLTSFLSFFILDGLDFRFKFDYINTNGFYPARSAPVFHWPILSFLFLFVLPLL